jgi:hypothetical protein
MQRGKFKTGDSKLKIKFGPSSVVLR